MYIYIYIRVLNANEWKSKWSPSGSDRERKNNITPPRPRIQNIYTK